MREVREETGVWAAIGDKGGLGQVSYELNGQPVRVKYFLMEDPRRSTGQAIPIAGLSGCRSLTRLPKPSIARLKRSSSLPTGRDLSETRLLT